MTATTSVSIRLPQVGNSFAASTPRPRAIPAFVISARHSRPDSGVSTPAARAPSRVPHRTNTSRTAEIATAVAPIVASASR